MAKELNQYRIHYTRAILVLAAVGVLFSTPLLDEESLLHVIFDMSGSLLVAACAIGRIYCTVFIGGRKNEALVSDGPFSICRNPLYFFSFLGACGIGMMSGHFVWMLALPILYCAVYFPLIAREEVYLLEHFGQAYREYCDRVPRFWPRLANYRAADALTVNVRYLHKALKDSVLWFFALPLFELIEKLQELGILHPFFVLP